MAGPITLRRSKHLGEVGRSLKVVDVVSKRYLLVSSISSEPVDGSRDAYNINAMFFFFIAQENDLQWEMTNWEGSLLFTVKGWWMGFVVYSPVLILAVISITVSEIINL